MRFAKTFLKNNPINYSSILQSREILPVQYMVLTERYFSPGPLMVPHSYSNKHNPILMRNTLDLLHELLKNSKK